MNRLGRFNLSEITIPRLLRALRIRLDEIPHTFTWEFSSLSRQNKKNLQRFKGQHAGRRCFIVANGPSLLKTNLDLLADDITFGVNRIYLNFEGSSFRPTYYVTVNELILEQCSDEISQLEMPKFINWNRRSCFEKKQSETLFLKSKTALKDSFESDITHPLVFGATVTFVALQLAYYMGFEQVILIGLDHYYADKGTPSAVETRTPEQDESHFHAQYFPKGFKWQPPDLLRSEIDFEIARSAFEADGREVLDASIGGHCQIFKKVDYQSLFNQPASLHEMSKSEKKLL